MSWMVERWDKARTRFLSGAPRARMSKALSVSLVTQVVGSITNFLLTLSFVRLMDADSFGIYGIGFAIVLLFSGAGNALFLTQMVVHLPDKAEQSGYLGRMLLLVSGFAVIGVLAGGLLVILQAEFAWLGLGGGQFILLTSLAAASYLLRDYFVRVFYNKRQELRTLAVTVVAFLATVFALVTAWRLKADFTPSVGIGIYAVGQFAGAVAGFVMSRTHWQLKDINLASSDFREAFSGGRWALGGVGVTWLQSQAYVYMSAIFVGPAAVGYANAARLFVAPMQLAMPAVNQVVMPRLSSLRSEGAARVAATGGRVTRLVLLGGLAYAILLSLLYPVAGEAILGGNFSGVGPLVAAWCVVLLAQLARDGASTIMQTLRKFRRLTVSSAILASLSLPAVALLAYLFGAIGAVVATAISELALALVLWLWIKRHAR